MLDLSMHGAQTPTNLRSMRECFPSVRLAAVSMSASRRDILVALEAGIHGYVLKNLPVAELVKRLATILEGGVYVPPCLADLSPEPIEPLPRVSEVSRPRQTAHHAAPAHLLTSRQREVLDLLVQGKTNKEIALALKLVEGTVKIHMAAIFRHFGVNNRAAAVVAAARPYPNRERGLLNG
ncbi:LuxR C-terminal-related transcriptional regulator [Microvirga yunnanensis]|uniref:LuxR C-terminal-related transcriptional regulator n=1 Tax=Microvirga yunnanensis TaxID=2953740 RepID=UPI0021C7D271|nr:response regulator transcription factor [Microvirga sp. HBU65207]